MANKRVQVAVSYPNYNLDDGGDSGVDDGNSKPDSFQNMIQCDQCGVWFHYTCAKVVKTPDDDWFCSVYDILHSVSFLSMKKFCFGLQNNFVNLYMFGDHSYF